MNYANKITKTTPKGVVFLFILEGAENPSPLGDGMNATH